MVEDSVKMAVPQLQGEAGGVSGRKGRSIETLVLLILAIGLYIGSQINYLVFHTVAEIFSITVSSVIAVIAWNTRTTNQCHFLFFLGLSLPFVGAIDLVHTLTYSGMHAVPNDDPNVPTQLWIAGRYIHAMTFVAAVLLAERPVPVVAIVAGQGGLTVAAFLGIFILGIFPDCYSLGQGLTSFKIRSEYVFCVMAVLALLLMWRQRAQFDRRVLRFASLSIGLTIPQELAFTLYQDVHGLLNATGHLIKILSTYMLYKAIVETALCEPYNLLFYKLRRSEEASREHGDLLERVVESRTAELRESEERHRALLECSNDWFWETDGQGRFTELSVRSEETTGQPVGELLGQSFATLLDEGLPAEDYPCLQDATGRRQSFRRLSFPLRTRNKGGRWMLVSGVPRFSAQGEFLGYWGTAADVTEQRRILDANRQRQTMVALGSMAGGLAHELNNLIQPVIGLSDLALRQAQEGSSLRTYLQAIHDSGMKARAIVRDVLAFARQEAPEFKPGDVAAGIHAALELASQLLAANVRVQVDIATGLQPVTITPTGLVQIILNLIQNAADALPEGGEVGISAQPVFLDAAYAGHLGLRGGEYVRMTIADNGMGMDEQIRLRVFEPFFTTKPVGKGTGLGLTVVYGIIRNGGGMISVDSAVGSGTVFTIDLPVASTGDDRG